MTSQGERPAAILDVDGTLVDSNYLHIVAWGRAFSQSGFDVPAWRIHRQVGKGGDTMIPTLLGDEAEAEHGDAIRAAHEVLYKEALPEVVALPGARDLIVALKERGVRVVLATSALGHELDRYLEVLDARDLLDGWTGADDVDRSKPNPDLVEAALKEAGGGPAVMVGDSPWDAETARRAGVETIGLLSGGFADSELRAAGVIAVFEDAAELAGRLDETPFGA